MSNLQDIKDRWVKATHCCWQVYIGENLDICVKSNNLNDADAIVNAQKDIQFLISEVEFLLKELEKQPTMEEERIIRQQKLRERYGNKESMGIRTFTDNGIK